MGLVATNQNRRCGTLKVGCCINMLRSELSVSWDEEEFCGAMEELAEGLAVPNIGWTAAEAELLELEAMDEDDGWLMPHISLKASMWASASFFSRIVSSLGVDVSVFRSNTSEKVVGWAD